MKPVIIIAIAFVILFVPISIFSQEGDLQNPLNSKEHNTIVDDLQILKDNSKDLQNNIQEKNNEINKLKSQISKIEDIVDTIVIEITKLHGGQKILNVSVNDHTLDYFAIFLTFVAILFAAFIAHSQYRQGTKIEDVTTGTKTMTADIHNMLAEQQETKRRLQTEYVRGILFLIRLARMEIHGMKVQIKFLKLDEFTDREDKVIVSKKIRMSRRKREELFEGHLKKLREIMIESKIDTTTILKLFEESTMLLYEKMWKMFVYANTLSDLNERYYESLMEQMIEPGVESSAKLHAIFIQYIPESQKKAYELTSVEPS